MNTPNKRYTLQLAAENDNEDISRLYEDGGFDGDIRVQFLRNPDAFGSLKSEGEKLVLMLLRDTQSKNQAVAMGACVIRKEYINRTEKRTGYLTALKILPEYRNKISFIPALYTFLNEQTKNDVDIYYTTILTSNRIALKMLEKKHTGMPAYHYHNNYTVYLFSPKRSKSAAYSLQKGLTAKVKAFYREQLPVCDFTPADVESYEIPDEMFFHLHNQNDEIVAACAVWNQQKNKQYHIAGYKGIYRIIPYLPSKWLGYPRFPRPHTNCSYLTCIFLRVKDNNPAIAETLIRKTGGLFPHADFLMLGLHDSSPFNCIFRHIKHVKYQSRFYTVSWDAEDPYEQHPRTPVGLEVGLL